MFEYDADVWDVVVVCCAESVVRITAEYPSLLLIKIRFKFGQQASGMLGIKLLEIWAYISHIQLELLN